MFKIAFKRLRKYYNFVYTKIKLLFRQKRYHKNGVELKYLFDRCRKSDCLIVVFSACVRRGLKARYNYVRTLKRVPANKLFILDDFADDHRGCYYLGQYPDYIIEKTVHEMVLEFCKTTGARKLLCCGSSKGGWAALDIGLDIDFPDITVIAGAPQYFLGRYIKYFTETFRFIVGGGAIIPKRLLTSLIDIFEIRSTRTPTAA